MSNPNQVVVSQVSDVTTVEVTTRGPQGPTVPDGNKGDVTVSSNGTAFTINNNAVTSAKILDGTIVDADINASAAIALSKLATGALPTAITVTSANISDLSIVDADISSSAAISLSKLATGALPTAITVTSANISDLSIVNADVNGSAAIAGTKISPDFGSQNIVTTGTGSTGALGVTGDITVSGTVDGRDLAADGTKLDGIETGATADQTAAEIKTLLNSNGIVNAQIDANAAIAGSKISPDFGSQNIATSGHIDLEDSSVVKLGTDDDFQLSYDNPNNQALISMATGKRLKLKCDSLHINNAADNSNILLADDTGAVSLFFGTSKKIETQSGGISVTGNLAVTGTVDGVEIATRDTLFGGLTSSSGVLTDGVTATTQSAGDNSTKVATTAYTDTAISNLVNSAPSTLDTLKELSDALGSDPNFATTVTNSIATKLPLAGGTLTGTLTISNAAPNLLFTESDANPDWGILCSAGQMKFQDVTATANILTLDSNKIQAVKNLDALAGIDVTGDITATGDLTISSTRPRITLNDTDSENDFEIKNENGSFRIRDIDSPTDRYKINSSGTIHEFLGSAVFSSTLNVVSNITVGGTVDGRDLSVDGAKLDGIASNAIANLVEDTSPQLGGDLQSNGNDIDFADNDKAIFGTGSDLEIFHDGTNSKIVNNTGHLKINADTFHINNAADNESLGLFTGNGSASLFFDNSKKLETTSNGSQITGNLGINTVPATPNGNSITLFANDFPQYRLVNSTTGTATTDGSKIFLNSDDLLISNEENGGEIKFKTNSSGSAERLKITAAGKLLVGTSTARTNFFNLGSTHTPRFQIESSNNDDGRAALGLIYGKTNASGPYIVMAKHRSNTVGDNTVVQSGDETGIIAFQGSDGSQFVDAARIQGFVDGTPGSDDMPGRLEFSTTADGAASPTTRLTIDSAGLVKLPDNGKFVAGAGSDLQIFHDGTHSHVLEKGSGNLAIHTDNELQLAKNDNAGSYELMGRFVADGAVELSFDNSKKFETTSTGATISGDASTGTIVKGRFNLRDTSSSSDRISWQPSSSILKFNNNYKAAFGDSSDLQIYHDGTHASISNTTGSLRYLSNTHYFSNPALSEVQAQFIQNSKCELRFDNAIKLETTSTGVSFNDGNISNVGTIAVDAIKGDADDNTNITFATNDVITFKCGSTSPALTVNTTQVKVEDSQKFVAGTGNDLEIYHDGSNSYIKDVGTGDLNIAGSIVRAQSSGGETLFRGVENGAVELYYDNSKKLETTTNGLEVTGSIFLGGKIDMGDSSSSTTGRILLGADDDLQIYHDGSNSYVQDSGTGNLIIAGSAVNILNAAANESMIRCTENGSVELRFDDSKKFETTSAGVKVKNTITLEEASGSESYQLSVNSFGGLDINNETTKIAEFTDASTFNLLDDIKFTCGTGADLQIYHSSLNDFIQSSGAGFFIDTNNTLSLRKVTGEDKAKFIGDGAVELYHDNSKKFETKSVGIQVYGSAQFSGNIFGNDNFKFISGAGSDLQIYHNGTHSFIQHTQLSGNFFIDSAANISLRTATNETSIACGSNGAVELYHDNSLKLDTRSSGVGIGGNVFMTDSSRLYLGSSNDFELFHDGTNSQIRNATGTLIFRSDNYKFRDKENSDVMATFNHDGAVELYHDNSKKFQTESGGASIFGNLEVDQIHLGDDEQIRMGANNDFILFHDPSVGNIMQHGFQPFFINSSNGKTQIKTAVSAAVELYHDGNKKFETTSSGITVTGSVTTQDMNMSNLNGSANEVDNTKGSWSIQEGSDDLFIINRVTGKKYKFNLTEIS